MKGNLGGVVASSVVVLGTGESVLSSKSSGAGELIQVLSILEVGTTVISYRRSS